MKSLFLFLSFIVTSFISGWIGWELNSAETDIDSLILSQAEAQTLHEKWGNLIIYTPEDGTATYGTKNTLTAVAVIKPGQQIHPPHQHTAEEFMYIAEGEGTWSLNGEESPARKGDVMYARPWDFHGIKNTGDTPLVFFVMKWDNKGIEMPAPEK